MLQTRKNTNKILLVEDDYIDILTIKRSFEELNLGDKLSVVKNGEEALQYLRSADTEKPGMILLDINMPRMNGLELLKILKNDHHLKSIPVVIVTTSVNEIDKIESFKYNVAGYFMKPIDLYGVTDIVYSYWSANELPNGRID